MTKTPAVILTPSSGPKDYVCSYSDSAQLCLCQLKMIHRLGFAVSKSCYAVFPARVCMRGKFAELNLRA
jgi:hypothetical protein